MSYYMVTLYRFMVRRSEAVTCTDKFDPVSGFDVADMRMCILIKKGSLIYRDCSFLKGRMEQFSQGDLQY